LEISEAYSEQLFDMSFDVADISSLAIATMTDWQANFSVAVAICSAVDCKWLAVADTWPVLPYMAEHNGANILRKS
jgi:hypothetical protein